jgi:dipeptidyl aminopeptidase/acylaminoacyl peptidase
VRTLLFGIAGAALLAPSVAQARAAAHPGCASILPPQRLDAGTQPLTPDDLVRLRDIGPPEPQYYSSPFFTLSPDGHWAAFQLRRADPERNDYCLAMVVVDLSGRASPRIVDEGGDLIQTTLDLRGIAAIPSGIPRVITPRWSSDGQWIAFLKRSGGSIQVWRANADGSGSAPLTHSPTDVVDFRFTADGPAIVYASRPDLERQRKAIEKDGLNGWHYDNRFNPLMSREPQPVTPAPRRADVVEIPSGTIRPATPAEALLVAVDDEYPAGAGAPIPTNVDGLLIVATNLIGTAKAGSLEAQLPDGTSAKCTAAPCEGASHPWWATRTHDHVRFLRTEGWASASTAIYDWDVGSGAVRRLYLTDDLLTSCTPGSGPLICLMHSSLVAGRLIRLDPESGERQVLFDLNPELARRTLGPAQRLHLRNAFGIESVADLVLPVGYRPGFRYPMVVVQYDTRGFLRGGTDDEYPIQAFANRGYAVLSFRRPQMISARTAKDFEQAGRLNLEHFADRRSVQSSLEAAIKLAVDRGIADPDRIGITGLSDGSTTVEWALIHSKLFAAAAMSSCCFDTTMVVDVGPSASRHFLGEGYPGILGRNDPFWNDVALEVNARRISTPILMNASEEEFPDALITYTALREAGVAVDLFEYPGEYHSRWQPAHRLATYRRSLDWFDFWLRNVRSTAPDRRSELEEWDRLKREAGHGHPI